MKYMKGALTFIVLTLTLMQVTDLPAFGFLGFGGTSWKEEVLLHDGSKIIVKRSQSYGGRGEIGQTPPIKGQDITFTVPGSEKSITWKSEYSEDIGRANFKLLALHVLAGTPYIVATPNLCLSYNKWGRPNPPYVFYKFDGKEWARIPQTAFPLEFKEINLVIDTKTNENLITAQSPVPAEVVRKINSRLPQPEYKTILREQVPENTLCPDWSSPRYTSPKAPLPFPSPIEKNNGK